LRRDPEIQRAASNSQIGIGDTVRVRYLADDRKTLQVTISRARNDSANGIIHHETPMAKALLGAEEGDEVEVLVGSYVRPALVETVIKAKVNEVAELPI
jgi:transcription elongation GreA/GreB family factor